MRTALLAAAACVIAIGVAAGQASKPAPAALPDWSGVWQMIGPTVFDRDIVQPQNGPAGDVGVFQRDGGLLEAEGAILTLLDLAKAAGAELRSGEQRRTELNTANERLKQDMHEIKEKLATLAGGQGECPICRRALDDTGIEHEEVYPELLARVDVHYERVDGLPWTEVDFPEDVVRAEREVLPRLAEV